MPEGVLLMTGEFSQSSDCERAPPMGKLPRLHPPGPGPGRFAPCSFGLSPSPERARRSTFSSVLFSSGRGNALPQFEQRCERAGFSTPHDRHFITEGWPSHGQLGDYPARLKELQEVSCENALSSSLQTQTPFAPAKRENRSLFIPLGSDFQPPIVSPSRAFCACPCLRHHTVPTAYCVPLLLVGTSLYAASFPFSRCWDKLPPTGALCPRSIVNRSITSSDVAFNSHSSPPSLSFC